MLCAQDLTLEQKAIALRKAHPTYAAAEVEAALLAHGGDVNATAAALVLGADARAEVRQPCVHLAAPCHCKRGAGVLLLAVDMCVLSCKGGAAACGCVYAFQKTCWLGVQAVLLRSTPAAQPERQSHHLPLLA